MGAVRGFALLAVGALTALFRRARAAALLTLLVLVGMGVGPLLGRLCGRWPLRRSVLVFSILGATALAWTVVLAWPGRAPLPLLVVLVVVLIVYPVTFETLLRRYDLLDPVLWQIAAIVHEADLEDDRYDARVKRLARWLDGQYQELIRRCREDGLDLTKILPQEELNELIPDWKEKGAPLETQVTDDQFLFLTKSGEPRKQLAAVARSKGVIAVSTCT